MKEHSVRGLDAVRKGLMFVSLYCTNYDLSIGKGLDRCMLKTGTYQAELSRITGISQPFISNMRNNKTIPNLRYAYLMARAMGVTLNDLVKDWDDIPDEELFGYDVRRAEASEHPKRCHGENDRYIGP